MNSSNNTKTSSPQKPEFASYDLIFHLLLSSSPAANIGPAFTFRRRRSRAFGAHSKLVEVCLIVVAFLNCM